MFLKVFIGLFLKHIMSKLNVGDKIPDFVLPNALGNKVSIKNFDNKYFVIYFYPKDDTPGCTIEALDFTKLGKDFARAGAVILGISKDSCESHQKFIDKHKLNVELLSDVNHSVQEMFGVWRKKKFMGREFMGTVRTTFLVDDNHKIVQVWDDVSAKGHANEVLSFLNKK